MAASPELRRPSSPAEFKLEPFLAFPPVEDRGRALPSSEEAEDSGRECRTPISKDSKIPPITSCTPTSNGSKIPPITSCPPAPRKMRRMEVISCKRRLSELELFRVGPELMELLFRPLDPRGAACLPASASSKKRKGCCQD